MAFVLMGLGSLSPVADDDGVILFYIPQPRQDTPGFETLQRDAQYTWASADRLSRDPAMQFVGPGEENIVVEGKMYPYHFGGLSTIKKLQDAGRAGKPHVLARFYPLDNNAYGAENLGNFVIKRVRTVESKIGAVGIAHKIDFTLELTRYGDDVQAAPAPNSGWSGRT
ncbi:phage protein U [Bradyrhizobium sp. AZCC 1610]|uniref:phage tail protein n=1 Tax=Bradyrhizobium sp. AZCC 1610 TaxID=3117020 RepID=UPI002FF1D90C